MSSLSMVMAGLRARIAPKYGEREATAMVRFIFRQLKGWDLTEIAFRSGEEVSEFVEENANDAVDRLLNDEPIQYIFESAPFYGMDLRVTPDVLIPRPETAMLVDMIVKDADGRGDLRVLDLGTGSGCIAIALARNLRFAEVTAVDVSAKALEIARENASRLKARVKFVESDLLKDDIRGEYDIIVSNPPYIAEKEAKGMEANVLQHEPHLALFVPDSDPLRFYIAIARIASRRLTEGGRLYLEINPIYAEELRMMLIANGFGDVQIIKDMDRRDRFISASKS